MALKKATKDTLWVAATSYLSLLVGLPAGFITPLFIDPAKNGLLAVVDSITEMLKNYPLGTHFAVLRELPHLRAQGRGDLADEVRDSTFVLTLLGILPVILVPVAVARWLRGTGTEFQTVLFIGCCASASWTLAGLLSNILKAEKRFKADSVLSLIGNALPLATLPVCLWLYGVVGYVLSGLIVSVVSLGMLVRALAPRPRLRMTKAGLRAALAFGIPSFVIGLADTAYIVAGRQFLQPIVSPEMLGLYYFAYRLTRYVLSLPQAVGKVYMPNLAGKLGSARPGEDLARFVVLPVRFMAWGMGLLIGGGALVLPPVLAALYPRYAPASEPLFIMLLGVFWPCLGTISWKHLVTTRRWVTGIAGQLAGVAAIGAGIWWFRGEMTLRIAALATAGGMFACYATFILISFRSVSRGAVEAVGRFASLGVTFALMLGAVLGLREAGGALAPGFLAGRPIVLALLLGLVFAVVWAPFLVLFHRRHGSFLRVTPQVPGPGDEEPGAGP